MTGSKAVVSLGPVSIALHWIVGLGFISLLLMGIYMEENEVRSVYGLHKSLGAILLLVIGTRIVWRLVQGWPVGEDDAVSSRQAAFVRGMHWVLLLGTALMPISGLLMSGFGGHGVSVFGWDVIAMNPDPDNAGRVLPVNEVMAQVRHAIHGLGGNIMMVAIALHVAGALMHHFIKGDRTLVNMLKPASSKEQ